MKCPYCGSVELKVIDKRATDNNESVRRRRECLGCQKRFTTYERLENVSIVIVKKGGTREQFDRAKLLRGLMKACEKRPVTKEQMDAVVDDVESELRGSELTEIPSAKIGQTVMKRLKRLDQVAYIRFASVYKEFKDLEDFDKEVQKLLKK
ncbi:TPA: transcriptional repressor NrdR [Candidatus Woesearchaeota archaeon]|nr:transcriptional repressor NrdR [Candidatus Woesearchaeota archaeon]